MVFTFYCFLHYYSKLNVKVEISTVNLPIMEVTHLEYLIVFIFHDKNKLYNYTYVALLSLLDSMQQFKVCSLLEGGPHPSK